MSGFSSSDMNVVFPLKLINWSLDGSDVESTTTPILLQDQNGPCPLVALVNTLVLQFDFRTSQVDAVNLSQSQTHDEAVTNLKSKLFTHFHNSSSIGLGDILGLVADLLLVYSEDNISHEIVDNILKQLPKLHTGLDVDPNLTNGNFAQDLATTLFDIFDLKFKHGWIIGDAESGYADDESIEHTFSILRELQTFDKVQDYLLLPDSDPAVAENQQHIRQWLDATCSQLTSEGLLKLDHDLPSPQFLIFFRNNHFNTLLKKSRNEFYLLVTDSSFQSKSGKLVWQSLNSVSGGGDIFFTGDFMPVLDIEQDIGQEEETLDSDLILSRQLQEEEDAAMARKMQEKYEKRKTRQSNKVVSTTENKETKAPNKVAEEKKKKKFFSFLSRK
ncbi:hypothetical protein KGF57_001800 [Candida theae]|uniref:MINDY deubiquitinase domain-containing protein n=1 Tax=Candida theae TaxID=1198502 RepID=A0AAD5FZK8_9ASCO|nr:uncharacterized protein KGF57_001800 [Candida theae]KAI5961051.1 hypothetical protein KGF57_001800 [Candida theae]